MTDILEFAEQAGQANIRFHIDNGDCIAKDSNTTLTILLAGAGAALGYWMKLLELGNHPTLSWGLAAVTIYLFTLAFWLVSLCMMVDDLEAPSNEPKNLVHTDYSLDSIREVELRNLQTRIENNIARNARKGSWLNRIRLALAFAPVIFGLGAATHGLLS